MRNKQNKRAPKRVGLDTNIFIYYFDKNPLFGLKSKVIFDNLSSNSLKATTNVITLIELLSYKKLSEIAVKDIERRFKEIPNLTLLETNYTIAITAAAIRREYGFRLADAIQLATTMEAKADVFMTNDQKLKNFKPLKVLLITEV